MIRRKSEIHAQSTVHLHPCQSSPSREVKVSTVQKCFCREGILDIRGVVHSPGGRQRTTVPFSVRLPHSNDRFSWNTSDDRTVIPDVHSDQRPKGQVQLAQPEAQKRILDTTPKRVGLQLFRGVAPYGAMPTGMGTPDVRPSHTSLGVGHLTGVLKQASSTTLRGSLQAGQHTATTPRHYGS